MTRADRMRCLLAADSCQDVSRDELAASLKSHRYLPTTDDAEWVNLQVPVTTLPTPLNDGAPNLSYAEQAGRSPPASFSNRLRTPVQPRTSSVIRMYLWCRYPLTSRVGTPAIATDEISSGLRQVCEQPSSPSPAQPPALASTSARRS